MNKPLAKCLKIVDIKKPNLAYLQVETVDEIGFPRWVYIPIERIQND